MDERIKKTKVLKGHYTNRIYRIITNKKQDRNNITTNMDDEEAYMVLFIYFCYKVAFLFLPAAQKDQVAVVCQ